MADNSNKNITIINNNTVKKEKTSFQKYNYYKSNIKSTGRTGLNLFRVVFGLLMLLAVFRYAVGGLEMGVVDLSTFLDGIVQWEPMIDFEALISRSWAINGNWQPVDFLRDWLNSLLANLKGVWVMLNLIANVFDYCMSMANWIFNLIVP